jgi:hypothetical protein
MTDTNYRAIVWHSPTTNECRWQSHLEVHRQRMRNGSFSAAYTLKMRNETIEASPVTVARHSTQQNTGWCIWLFGEQMPDRYATKFDAQRDAEELLGVGWRYAKEATQ